MKNYVVMFVSLFLSCSTLLAENAPAKSVWNMQLRSRVVVDSQSQLYGLKEIQEQWIPAKTAIIVCDMWNEHWCRGATARVQEMAPRMNALLTTARSQGATIVHAPSGCMKYYATHEARLRAQNVAMAANLPKNIQSWCTKIAAEEGVVYPLDQADGGCDCSPHCKTRNAWNSQIETLTIDKQDCLSDSGVEIWNVLEARGIENIMVLGVHTNMCVLGRPFGLRQLAQNGKHVVLVRDLTDTMYNHESWPYVNHFRGNNLIVEHIEKHVCSTVTSDQILGGNAFRFASHKVPHVTFMIGEDEYQTKDTLPAFAQQELQPWGVKTSFIHASDSDKNDFPGLEALVADSDLLVVSVRRRTPKADQLALVRKYIESGKPVVGIRTASHAFSPHKNLGVPEGCATWLEFDSQVLGGNYTGHYGNNAQGASGTVFIPKEQAKHAILAGITANEFSTFGSIYKTGKLSPAATLLMSGMSYNQEPMEAVAWTHRFGNSRVFYTSLGHKQDFAQPPFVKMLSNAIFWAMEPSSN